MARRTCAAQPIKKSQIESKLRSTVKEVKALLLCLLSSSVFGKGPLPLPFTPFAPSLLAGMSAKRDRDGYNESRDTRALICNQAAAHTHLYECTYIRAGCRTPVYHLDLSLSYVVIRELHASDYAKCHSRHRTLGSIAGVKRQGSVGDDRV